MSNWSARIALVLVIAMAFACGNGKPKPKDGKPKPDAGVAETDTAKDEQVKSARDRIAEWLGDAAATKIKGLGADLGKEIGAKLSSDPEVKKQITKLTKKILGEKKVKKQLDKIADKATEGFMNKITLGWKAIKAGGVKEYKKKVKENTTKIASEVIEEWVREHLFKHERMAETMKKFLPVLKVQGQVAAVSVQENLSPEASKKILGIALKLAAAGDSAETSKKVEAWIGECEGKVESEIEKLFVGVAELKSLEKALQDLAVEILSHKRTADELSTMVYNLTKNKQSRKAMVKAYDKAAFEKGDKAVRKSLEELMAVPVVDEEVFAAMERLAEAEGAGQIIEKHLAKVGEDPELGKLADQFILSLLETCGDPLK
jgi:hypothetical protein